jgi:LAO/AO transport system kinase
MDELIEQIERHRDVATSSRGDARRRSIAAFRLQKTAEHLLVERFNKASAAAVPALADRLSRRQGDPYALANELLASASR